MQGKYCWGKNNTKHVLVNKKRPFALTKNTLQWRGIANTNNWNPF